MKLHQIGLDELVAELEELPTSWMDERAEKTVAYLKVTLERLRDLDRPVIEADLADELRRGTSTSSW